MPAPTLAALPETCEIAFKEWAGICASLRAGDQSIILRKGGVAEGPNGFVPEHDTFWLYPTFVHEAEQGLKHHIPATNIADPNHVLIDTLVHVDSVTLVDEWPVLERLDDFHAWTRETVLNRFHYKRPALWVLGVRAYALDQPHRLKITPEHLGCKTWVPLGTRLSTSGARPVRSDEQAAADRLRLAEALKTSGTNP